MILCAQDNQGFLTPELLEQHLLSDHKILGKPMGDTAPPPPMSPEFLDTLKSIEEDKKKKLKEVVKAPAPVPIVTEPAKLEPIRLTYRYTGNHSCGNPVETLEMDVDKKHFVTAFCLSCKVQVEVREVASLDSHDTIDKVKEKAA